MDRSIDQISRQPQGHGHGNVRKQYLFVVVTIHCAPAIPSEPSVELVTPLWVLGPLALEQNGVASDVKVAQVLARVSNEQDRGTGDLFSDGLWTHRA